VDGAMLKVTVPNLTNINSTHKNDEKQGDDIGCSWVPSTKEEIFGTIPTTIKTSLAYY
jgi:hypothetical protein